MDTTPLADADADAKQRLPIKTYHCRFCSHLLLASTRELLSSSTPLRRRRVTSTMEGGAEIGEGVGGLDGAIILELPPPTRKSDRKLKGDSKGEAYEDNQSEERHTITHTDTTTATATERGGATVPSTTAEGKKTEQAHYTIPLSTLLPDPTPVIIRREDGFEKRLLLRCGRCRVVVGYRLCNTAVGPTTDQDLDVDEEGEEDEDSDTIGLRQGKQEGAIYLLPGSIVGTEDLDVGTEGGGPNAMIERNAVLKGMEAEWVAWIK